MRGPQCCFLGGMKRGDPQPPAWSCSQRPAGLQGEVQSHAADTGCGACMSGQEMEAEETSVLSLWGEPGAFPVSLLQPLAASPWC